MYNGTITRKLKILALELDKLEADLLENNPELSGRINIIKCLLAEITDDFFIFTRKLNSIFRYFNKANKKHSLDK